MRALELGASRSLTGVATGRLALPPHHLLTHSVAVGMTGSGKTGLLLVLAEEALRSGIPVLMVDLKGDLPNLTLAFPEFGAAPLMPWADGLRLPSDERPLDQVAQEAAEKRRAGLSSWGIAEEQLRQFHEQTALRVITPGSNAGELVHLLSALERPSQRWQADREAAEQSLSAAISLLLRLVGRDPDPARSREHVLLSVLAQRRLAERQASDLRALIADLIEPPLAEIGALPTSGFVSDAQRGALAASLNALLVAPTFSSWRTGSDLDIGSWLEPQQGRTSGVVFSVAHLEEEERKLVLGLLFDEILSWVRSLSGTQRLRALVMIDEVYGLLPPHPANPATKGPIVQLMKQARAYGIGVVLATQNPMDLDYRALSNAGLWCIGRLQTDADRDRVIDGLSLSSSGHFGTGSAKELNQVVKKLAKRWFVVRDVHSETGVQLLNPRYAMSFMRGPMTRSEIRRAVGDRDFR